MEEADRLCERIAIMDEGRILALDTPDGLKRLIPGGTMLELRLRVPEMVGALRTVEDGTTDTQNERFRDTLGSLSGVTKVEQLAEGSQSETLAFRLYGSSDAGTLLANAAQTVIQEQGELLDLRFTRPSLEDVFIYLTGRNLRS
jgi:ABC-2 type transport system ATP-binding protein